MPLIASPSPALPDVLRQHIHHALVTAGGWLGFDAFMDLALYTPGLGYYAKNTHQFGLMPGGVQSGGSDFVTAPELSPRFGHTLAKQIEQALEETDTTEVWEFGAGSGALAAQILESLGRQLTRYHIVELSNALQTKQAQRLISFGEQVKWHADLPEKMQGIVLGNEVLDAMPVKLLARIKEVWHERGVVWHDGQFAWADQATPLRPPVIVTGQHDYLTEIHLQAEGFLRTLADRLHAGAVFLLDYGFPEHEYYHPQRSMGTVMCHQQHQVDGNPLQHVGHKDITAHVNFTGMALAGQEAGLQVLGYTSQGRFLLNCGVLSDMEEATLRERAMMQKLLHEQEMGELFKVIAWNAPQSPMWTPMGFAIGDRTHTL